MSGPMRSSSPGGQVLRIIATAASQDFAGVRDLGADTVIDFHAERFEDMV